MTTVTESHVYYDPYDAEINADPYPTYRRLRDEAPIYYNDRFDVWAMSRHADVEKALVNWQTFSNTPQRHPRDHPIGHRPAVGRRDLRRPAVAHDAPRRDVARLHAAAA